MANTARYWRINHLSVGSTLGEQGQTSTANIILADLYFYALSTDTTPLSGTYTLAPAWSAWNVIGSNATSVLTDGNITNTSVVWNENSGAGIGVTFDAGSPTTVGKIRISSIDTNQYAETPVRWVLEASSDGVNWIDTGVLVVETTAWTQAEIREYAVSPSFSIEIQVNGIRAYVVSDPSIDEAVLTTGIRAYVVSEAPVGESTSASSIRAYVVSQEPYPGGLGQGTLAARPEFIQGATNYVKFEPETNNKKLMFYPETAGDHTIIALRANLEDFFENTQAFTLGSWQQVYVPHFNQLFITSSTLTTEEVDGIKSGMLSRATGTGINIDAGTPNSVSGGLKDPSIFGVLGPQTQISFLLGTESGIQDEGYYSITMTPNGGAAQSSDWAQFGTYSAAFNLDGGTDDYYNLGSPATCHMDFGTEAFTIEGFAKATRSGYYHAIIGNGFSNGVGSCSVYLNPSNQLFFTFPGVLTATATTALGTDPFHFAVCREGNNLRMYVNGVLEADSTNSAWTTNLNSTADVKLGSDNYITNAWEGYLDEIRVVKGLALYSGPTMTVPTAPYPRP